MKYLNKLLPVIWAVAFALIFQTAQAQQNIDANRMNRDINIMENILQELFKTSWAGHGSTVQVATGAFPFGRSNDIRGTYLPGYGVIFTIDGGPPAFVMMSDAEGENSTYAFRYGDNGDGEEVTEEAVLKRIKEFLRDYGSTIGQLSEDEHVMVIYDTQKSNRINPFFISADKETKKNILPTISVVASKKDLNAYRSGNISESQFDNRLNVTKVASDTRQKLDLKVLANIFETAFKDQDEPGFMVRGSVSYLSLDNFGALFSFDARYGSSSFSRIFSPDIDIKPSDIASVDVRKGEDGESRITIRKKDDEERTIEIAESRKQQKADVVKAYNTFVNSLKEYLVDYGRTLSSVQSDQHILVSVSLSSRIDEVPDRIDLQIRKSVLEQMDRGSIDRDRALQEITLREY